MLKMAIITAFLGKTKDRFHEYNKALTLDEKFAVMNTINGYDGVEVVYPYEVPEADEMTALLNKHSLKVAAVNVNVKAEEVFKNGGLTSLDPEIRKQAITYIKNAKDYAKVVGADKVTCCPLGDGYEFAFQYDYAVAWKNLVNSFAEAADHCKEIPLFVEYKPSETRGKCFIDTASKTLCLLNDIQGESLGVTLDFGHSIYGNENPAEALVHLAESKYPYYVHINDNDGKWDWDYFCGTKHYLDYVEFIYYLKKYKYSDYLTSDTSPTRWDVVGTFEANSRLTNKVWNLLNSLDTDLLEQLMRKGDYLQTWKFIESEIFSLK